MVQGCIVMSPILFCHNYINQLVDEFEKAAWDWNYYMVAKVGGLMFADDFVGLTTLVLRTDKR